MSDSRSIMSVSSLRKFGKKINPFKAKQTKTSNFYVEEPRPAQKKDGPSLRDIKPSEAKDEITGTKRAEQKEEVAKDEEDEAILKEAEDTISPPQKQKAIDSTSHSSTPTPITSRIKTAKYEYAAIINHEATDLGRRVRFSATSTWVPNALSLFATLFAMHNTLHGNQHLIWKYKNYLSFPVTIYYSVIYYIRILSVMEKFGLTTSNESSFIRRFTREFSFSQLPIALPLVPFFNSISAYRTDDDRCSWIVPVINRNLGGDGNTDIHSIASAPGTRDYMTGWSILTTQPIVPALLDWFKTFCTVDINATIETTAAAGGNAAINSPRYEQDDRFVMQRSNWTSNNTDLIIAGRTITGAVNNVDRWYMNVLGLGEPHPESFDEMVERRRFWLNSALNVNSPALSQDGSDFSNIANFLGFDGSLQWFNDCINAAIIQAKFFGGARPLSALDYHAGPETVIYTHITVGNNNFPGLPIAADRRAWHVMNYSNTIGNIFVYEDDVHDDSKMVAKHALVNAKVDIRYKTNAHANADAFGTQSSITRAQGCRLGPFYNCHLNAANTVANNTSSISTLYETTDNVTVLDARRRLLLESFYVAEP